MQFPTLTCTWVITYNCFHVSSCLLPEEDRDSVKDSSCLANFWLHSESWLNAKNNSFAFPSPSPSGCLSSIRYSPSMKWSRLSMIPRVGWRGWEPWSSITTYCSELRKRGSLKVKYCLKWEMLAWGSKLLLCAFYVTLLTKSTVAIFFLPKLLLGKKRIISTTINFVRIQSVRPVQWLIHSMWSLECWTNDECRDSFDPQPQGPLRATHDANAAVAGEWSPVDKRRSP